MTFKSILALTLAASPLAGAFPVQSNPLAAPEFVHNDMVNSAVFRQGVDDARIQTADISAEEAEAIRENVLKIQDEIVVHPSGGDFDRIDIDGNEIIAGVGAKLKEVAYAAKNAGLGGLEFMEGIPGAVGGGLRMNAGAMGAQLFENVVRVRYLGAGGNAHEKTREEVEVHYRNFPLLENNFAVSAVFRGQPAAVEEIVRKLEASQEKRRTTQPAAKSAGCIFKNPDSCPAGKLVDELGLKNSHVGKARVSDVHGNFIVNDGGATALEMLELIEKIKATARAKRGIELETEVQIVGED